MLFSKPSKAVGVDIGAHSVKAVQMSRVGGNLRVDCAGYSVVDRNQVNVDPVAALADATSEAIRFMAIPQSLVVGALPGQTVVIRYPHLPDMPYDQISMSIENEAAQSIPYDLSEVFIDWSLLDKVTEDEETTLKVLLIAARHEVIESRVQIADASGIQYGILSVDSLSLADAAECCDLLRVGESVAIINIGSSSTSIHFVKDGVSNFIRDVSWGAQELIQAIAKGRRCDYDEAERILQDAVMGGLVEEEQESFEPVQEEQPPPADVPMGAGLLDPLDEELGGIGDAPGIDMTEPMKPPAGMGGQTEGEKSVREILHPPLARLVTEIRRSFEYYEHQLYEKPVDRLILSGGIAGFELLKDTFISDLGMDSVEAAGPHESALFMGDPNSVSALVERPAQFMVAVGLAARGMADL